MWKRINGQVLDLLIVQEKWWKKYNSEKSVVEGRGWMETNEKVITLAICIPKSVADVTWVSTRVEAVIDGRGLLLIFSA